MRRPRLVQFSTFLNRALYELKIPETKENLRKLRIYSCLSNEETEITQLYGHEAWSKALQSYRNYFQSNHNQADRFVVFVFYFDSQPILGNPSDATSQIIWDRTKYRRATIKPNPSTTTLEQLAPYLILKMSQVPNAHAEVFQRHSEVLGKQLYNGWGDYKTALNQRKQGLIDLLQLLTMAPQSAQNVLQVLTDIDDDNWSDEYITKVIRERITRAGTAGWSLTGNAEFFVERYWRGTFGGQFAEIDRALRNIRPSAAKAPTDGVPKKVLIITPTLGTAILVYTYYRRRYGRSCNPYLYDSELGDGEKKAIVSDFESDHGKIGMLIVDAQELARTTVDVQAASSIFVTGPLQDKVLYAHIWSRASADGGRFASVVPVLLVVENAPIHRILMAEEYAGRTILANPFNTKQPLLVDDTN